MMWGSCAERCFKFALDICGGDDDGEDGWVIDTIESQLLKDTFFIERDLNSDSKILLLSLQEFYTCNYIHKSIIFIWLEKRNKPPITNLILMLLEESSQKDFFFA